MVLPQAMAWVQYWFRVLSLKFCGKSKKNCGDISQLSPAFCMYGLHSDKGGHRKITSYSFQSRRQNMTPEGVKIKRRKGTIEVDHKWKFWPGYCLCCSRCFCEVSIHCLNMFNPNIQHNTKKPSMNIVQVTTTIASVIITRTKKNDISLFKLRYLKALQSKQKISS